MQPQLTRIAADAIIAQMVSKADDEATKYAMIDGVGYEFTVHFEADWVNGGGHYINRDVWAECTIIGAWAADPDTGEVAFAGNRVELEALLGNKLLCAWEADLSQSHTDRGR